MSAGHVQPGDPQQISARVYNYAVDQYSRSIGSGFSSDSSQPRTIDSRLLVKNLTGMNRERLSIVQFDAPVTLPSTNEGAFLDRPVLKTTANPPAADQNKWGILQEAIPNNEFGECLISGVTYVKILSSAASNTIKYAKPNASYTALVPASCGKCCVLWIADGTGERWAIVNLG